MATPRPIPAPIRASVILFSRKMFPQFCRSAVVVTACAFLLSHGLVSPRPPGVTHVPSPTVVSHRVRSRRRRPGSGSVADPAEHDRGGGNLSTALGDGTVWPSRRWRGMVEVAAGA